MSIRVTAPFLWTVGTIFPVVCTVVVGARFAMRRAQRGIRGLDDWLTLPALVLVWGMAAAILAGTGQMALGYPTPNVDPTDALSTLPPQEVVVRKVYWAMTLLQMTALTCIKISCMLFFRRIFYTGMERAISAFTYTYIFLSLGWFLSFFFAFLFACGTHFANAWGTPEQVLSCPADSSMIDQGMSYMDLILDVIILVFPLPFIWRLHLTITRKLLVSFIFFLGSLAVLASIARVVIIVLELNGEAAVIFDEKTDQNFTATAGVYFMFLEACFGLCAICLPSLSGIFKLKPVQTLIAGFSSMLSDLSGSSRRSSREQTTESTSKKTIQATIPTSDWSEQEAVLTAAAAGPGETDNWKTHGGPADIEMISTVMENRV